jgi:hypothetical protein
MPRSKLPDHLIALALLFCVVAGCKQLNKQIETLAKPTVLKSADGKFQITVPAGWRPNALSHEKADIKAGNPLEEMYVLVLTEMKADFTDETTLDDYTGIVKETIASNLTSPEATPALPLTINGNAARQYEVQGASNNLKIAYIVTTVETSEHFHQIVTWTLRSRINKNQATLQKVASTFRPATPPVAIGSPP